MLIKACLNGGRDRTEHPAVPITPAELAADAARVIAAGAGALHAHPRDTEERQTLVAEACDVAVMAIRASCPGTPVGLSTGDWMEPNPVWRVALVRSWRSRPDFASVNFSEPGALEVCAALREIGVGVEAGLWTPADARLFVDSGAASFCLRVLIETMEPEREAALANAEAIIGILDEEGVTVPRLLHGEGPATWDTLREALRRGYDIRIGLEDTLALPDGSPARDNAQLVETALQLAVASP